jgi:hypothetical protein
MARVRIAKPDGSPSKYFWNDKEPGEKDKKSVYKKSAKGVTRMRGVHFDAVQKKLKKD